MGNVLIMLAVLVVIAVVAKILLQRLKTPAEYPYQKEPSLFTPAEKAFFMVLNEAIGETYYIMGKVRLADVIKVKPGLARPEWQKAFNRIQSKHLDFVCCDPNDMSVRFAVELDDKSHDREDRQERDAFLDAAIEKAGIPLVRFAVKASYSVQEIKDTIQGKLTAPTATPPQSNVQPSTAPTTPTCPSCGGDMVKRKAAKGENAGQEFWGCSNYPKCRETMPI
jgi:hypothetical protein